MWWISLGCLPKTLLTVGKESIHFDEGIAMNLHYTLLPLTVFRQNPKYLIFFIGVFIYLKSGAGFLPWASNNKSYWGNTIRRETAFESSVKVEDYSAGDADKASKVWKVLFRSPPILAQKGCLFRWEKSPRKWHGPFLEIPWFIGIIHFGKISGEKKSMKINGHRTAMRQFYVVDLSVSNVV